MKKTSLFERLVGGKALEEREAELAKRLDAEKSLREACEEPPAKGP